VVSFTPELEPGELSRIVADRMRELAGHVQHALDLHLVIDQAAGIVMSRAGCTAEQAMDHLRGLAQREHERLHVVAQRVVDETVRSARP